MKHRQFHNARQAWDNVSHRVRRKGGAVALCDRETFIAHVCDIWPADGSCESCKRRMGWFSPRQPDMGATPSVHKVNPGKGYVPGNLRVICSRCNTAIGDAATHAEIDARIAALNWQRSQI